MRQWNLIAHIIGHASGIARHGIGGQMTLGLISNFRVRIGFKTRAGGGFLTGRQIVGVIAERIIGETQGLIAASSIGFRVLMLSVGNCSCRAGGVGVNRSSLMFVFQASFTSNTSGDGGHIATGFCNDETLEKKIFLKKE